MNCRTTGVCGVLGAMLAVAACGDHKNLGADATEKAQGGSAGKSAAPNAGGSDDTADAAGAPSNGGATQATGGTTGAGTAGTSSSNDGGAGTASGATDPRYDFFLLPDVATPNPFKGGTTVANVESRGQSADGKLVFGVCSWKHFSPDDAPAEGGQVPFRWSPTTGSVAMPELNEEQPGIQVAANGASAFVSGKDGSGKATMLRWTAGGAKLLKAPGPAFDQLYPVAVSADGRVAFVSAQRGDDTVNLVWRESEGNDQLVEIPYPFPPALSPDGSVAYFQLAPAINTTQLLRWVVAAGPINPIEVAKPAGYQACELGAGYSPSDPQPMNADGSVISGNCGVRGKDTPVMFRWQVGETAMHTVADGPAWPQLSSMDGTQVLGTGKHGDPLSDYGQQPPLTWWTPDGAVRLPNRATLYGVSSDHSTAWLENRDAEPGHGASRWTRSGGLQELPGLEGAFFTHLVGVSDDGTLAVGYSQVPEDEANMLHILLWDMAGQLRDITVELREAGFTFEGTATQPINKTQLTPTKIWSGNPIRIGGNTGGSQQRATWFATVPQQR